VAYYFYAALLPRRGPHYASHSVCPSVRPVMIITERHVAPPGELQWHTHRGPHNVRPSRPHKLVKTSTTSTTTTRGIFHSLMARVALKVPLNTNEPIFCHLAKPSTRSTLCHFVNYLLTGILKYLLVIRCCTTFRKTAVAVASHSHYVAYTINRVWIVWIFNHSTKSQNARQTYLPQSEYLWR